MISEFEGTILFVGAGKMGGAMIAGLMEEGLDPSSLKVQDPGPPPEIIDLLNKYEIQPEASVSEDTKPTVVILSVKPQIMDKVLPGLVPLISKDTVVLSIAAGKTIAGMEKHVGADKPVVRAMPNTPAAVGRGMTALYANQNVTSDQKELVGSLLTAIGEIAWCNSESDIDAVTAVSGSGPAYLFWMTECMAHAGIEAGLEEDLAWRLAKATVSGAGELMRLAEETPTVLRENVTSPNGTTAAALDVLMAEDGLKPLMAKAVQAAKKRSIELSE